MAPQIVCNRNCSAYNASTCVFDSCKWDNATNVCHASGGIGSTGYIGIILALVGNIIIK